ncbi:calcium-binding protein [Rubellimicrobium roseum]|uniref:Peptidase M10 serralysin C-terminal domain-containing protein n=1 Tax=Rubellimicrobium roseum TaxID=687525 RepID=A0A5C4NAD3_9RHOB|nr:M10 family metallopeptidase C-terminal domain-containing protein [Rubellimicrobium roseum]TNC62135.1 hypothetical protein FHG71_20470 [Rubellimicrobium roseum]
MGKQFLVNSYQNNWQREPDVLARPNGGFTVVWSSYFNEFDGGPSSYVLSGQSYDASGRREGGEFIIDAVDGGASTVPSIMPLTNGRYAIGWSYSSDGILGREQSWVQAFNVDDTPRGSAARVDTSQLFQAVTTRVAGTGDGGFLALYIADQSDSNFDDVYVRRFDSSGRTQGKDVRVNTKVDFLDQYGVEAVSLTNGNVLAIWNSEETLDGPNGSRDFEIRGSLFSPEGKAIRSDFHITINVGAISSFGQGAHFDVTGLQGGGFAVARFDYGFRHGTEKDPLLLQTFDAAGRATAKPVTVYATEEVQYDAEVAQLATGEIVVVWEQRPINGDVGEDLYGRIFSAGGRALTGVFQVGENFDGYDVQEEASLKALAGGGFVVAYTHDNLDAEDEGVAARIFGRGTGGNDSLGVDGSGYLAGGGGNDVLTGNGRSNVLNGGSGNDRLRAEGGSDALSGGDGRDVLLGQSGHDSLRGGNGDDTLDGGSGADRLDGGMSKDRLHAGKDSSRDVFDFNSIRDSRPSSHDILLDFDRGEDVIDLRGIDARGGSSRNDGFDYSGHRAQAHSVWWSERNGDVVVSADVTGDRTADFQLRLDNLTRFSSEDVLL